MSIKITIPNSSSDVLTFGSGNTPTAAQIAGIDSGSSNGQLALYTTASGTSTERVRVDASGNVGIGTSSPNIFSRPSPTTLALSGSANAYIQINGATGNNAEIDLGINSVRQASIYTDATAFALVANTNIPMSFSVNNSERMRIDTSGNLLVGKTAVDTSVAGAEVRATGFAAFTRSADIPLLVNRLTDDGTLVSLRQASTEEGTISVSGTTVSYNGGHLSRWAQMLTTPELFKGTVMSNLDEMNVYTKDGQPVDNEQLNKVKVSDTEGDVNVAGVFVNWSHDDDHNVDEINMAMTGDMIIRIAQGTTVARGDLLMSAGDGTAKPQGDDIVRSKTVAKVTSTHVTCIYADGSFCVPCVLMAC